MDDNHCVPDFEMEEDCSAEGFSRAKKPATEVMELLWQNGPVVVQSQNPRPPKKTAYGGIQVEREIRLNGGEEEQQHLFMQEDEMATWLNYPLEEPPFDADFFSDLQYAAAPPPPPATISTITTQTRAAEEIRSPTAAPRPPIPPRVTKPEKTSRIHNFGHFSKLSNRMRRTEAMSKTTVVESNETPILRTESRISQNAADNPPIASVNGGAATAAGKSAVSSKSPGEPSKPPPAAEDRKRKSIEIYDSEEHSEDMEFETGEAKKKAAKRSRAAQVHNLSERRRRDRINEKMRALQELIPCCNKSDKASMLDEAIEYLKSLQLQVQMMTIGCGMVPMMYPGMPQYMPMVPYPGMLPGSAMPSSSTSAQMGPRFPMPAFHMPPVLGHGPSTPQPPNQSGSVLNPLVPNNPNQPRIPNFVDPYQQFLGLHQAQLQIPPQNQAEPSPSSHKSGSSKDPVNPDNNQEAG